jgi:hypothetical protein
MKIHRPFRIAAIVALAAIARPVAAQSVSIRSDERTELRGDVVASDTGEPIAGAWIALEGRGYGTYSRRDGTFRLPEVPTAARRYDVEALGYLPTTITLDPLAPDLVLRLEPDEALLPGLTFLLEHIEERRNGARLFDREALAFSRAFDLADFLNSRGVRGVRKFCLDERWSPGLEGSTPESFYRMEIHGATARLYTEEYLLEMATEDAETVRQRVRPEQSVC